MGKSFMRDMNKYDIFAKMILSIYFTVSLVLFNFFKNHYASQNMSTENRMEKVIITVMMKRVAQETVSISKTLWVSTWCFTLL